MNFLGNYNSEKDKQRAERAKQILEDPMVIEAFANLKKIYLYAGNQAGLDSDKRRKAADLLFAVDALENHFATMVETGRLLRIQESELKKGSK